MTNRKGQTPAARTAETARQEPAKAVSRSSMKAAI
jgi:hypothetical protein